MVSVSASPVRANVTSRSAAAMALIRRSISEGKHGSAGSYFLSVAAFKISDNPEARPVSCTSFNIVSTSSGSRQAPAHRYSTSRLALMGTTALGQSVFDH
jgi:hypothetical protein